MVKSPKVYIHDSGLLHALLRIRTMEDLQSHPSLGSSWEAFVIEQIIGLISETWECYFYRTVAGEESYPLGNNVFTLPLKDIARVLEH